jgi:hypothetical protein
MRFFYFYHLTKKHTMKHLILWTYVLLLPFAASTQTSNKLVGYIGAGATLYVPAASGSAILRNLDFRKSVKPEFSAGVALYTRCLKNLIPAVQVQVSPFLYSGAGRDALLTTAHWYFKAEGYTATITPSLEYRFIRTRQLDIQAGAGMGINLSHYRDRDILVVSGNVGYYDRNDYHYRLPWYSGCLTVGAVYKQRYGVAFRTSAGKIAKADNFSVRVVQYALSLRWCFSLNEKSRQ